MKIFSFVKSLFGTKDTLAHVGTPHENTIPHSGRYPWGSGDNAYQHDTTFAGNARKLRDQGLSEKEIANTFGMTINEYRQQYTLSKNEEQKAIDDKIKYLRYEKQWSNTAIAKEIYKDQGLSEEELAKKESNIRYRLKTMETSNQQKTDMVINALREDVDKYGAVDIGLGSEAALGCSATKLRTAAKSLENEGYVVSQVYVKQAGTGGNQKTVIKFVAKPGTTMQYMYDNLDKIAVLGGLKGSDDGNTVYGIKTPTSVDSSKVLIRYAEDGGTAKDGTIELRRGVDYLDLGNASYAQVRIAVDGTHYMKGMALYKDDIPEGYDVVFNTNKHVGTPMLGEKSNTVLKNMKDDPDNPFGATFKMDDGKIVGQRMYVDKNGKEQLSPINIVREEGDWNEWSKTLASQFLSKQPIQLIKQQLDKSYDDKKQEYDEIMALTNPIVKEKLLESFADGCDSAAVHLKAASLPGQSCKVILPFNSIADGEIYAPTYQNGEEVILIRYPHGGTFEIPRLTVNNNNPEAKQSIGLALDAVGINSKVASQLSGADFDGDSVVVIPTKGQQIVNSRPLKGLENFEPKELYKIPDYLTEAEKDKLRMKDTQMQMGRISNLITDMTLQGASSDELERAVKHSMVVIDAEKHDLDYKRSYNENRIRELIKEYQPGTRSGGASTLISKAKSPEYVLDRKLAYSKNQLVKEPSTELVTKYGRENLIALEGQWQYKDPSSRMSKPVPTGEATVPDKKKQADYDAGKKVYINTYKLQSHPSEPEDLLKEYGKKNLTAEKGYWYIKEKDGTLTETGRRVEYVSELKKTKSTKMAETDDANKLSLGNNPKEDAYAEYANKLKSLANDARKEQRSITTYDVSPSAKEIYKNEVESLENSLLTSKMNKPLERKAQAISNVIYNSKVKDNPNMDEDEQKKVKTQSLAQARNITGASKKYSNVQISDKEWEAIQARAISATKLREIINNTDEDRLKKLATPRDTEVTLTASQMNLLKSYAGSGMTIAEIASALGLSTNTISKYIKQI